LPAAENDVCCRCRPLLLLMALPLQTKRPRGATTMSTALPLPLLLPDYSSSLLPLLLLWLVMIVFESS
jgi:hypothetical protein